MDLKEEPQKGGLVKWSVASVAVSLIRAAAKLGPQGYGGLNVHHANMCGPYAASLYPCICDVGSLLILMTSPAFHTPTAARHNGCANHKRDESDEKRIKEGKWIDGRRRG